MLDDDGHILKLLDKNTKLVYMEQEFYETLYNKEPDNEEWAELKKFVPKFHGTVELIHNERYCILFTLLLQGHFLGTITITTTYR